jgi:predicted DNA-binding transcriptional regulator AlpA
MNRVSFQIGITLDADALEVLTEIMKQAIERSTSRLMRAMEEQERSEARIEQSRTAIFAGKKPPENMGLLIDSKALSKLLDLSQGTIYTMEKEGRMPAAIRIGKAVRWGLEEITAWIEAGCPDRANWQWPRT